MPALNRPIAVGRTAEIFTWDDGHVLKLYREWCPPTWVDYELKIGRIVQEAGLAVPAIGELVEVDNRRGVTYERIDGITMLATFRAKPWTLLTLGRAFAELHVAMHDCAVPIDLPSQRDGFANSIRNAPNLPSDLRDAVLSILAALPDDNLLCHGDFHPDNVMMTSRGPIIIDWMTAKRGNALADVARTLLLLTTGEPTSFAERMIVKLGRQRFIDDFLHRYFELRRRDDHQLAAWRPIIAAARMNEKIPGEEKHLLATIRAELK